MWDYLCMIVTYLITFWKIVCWLQPHSCQATRNYQMLSKQRKIDLTYQDMPYVLIGSFKAAEADTSTQQTLPPPHVTGCNLQLPHPLGFRVVHFKSDCFFHIGFQEVFQQVTFFILNTQKYWTWQLWKLKGSKTTWNRIKESDCNSGLLFTFYCEERKKNCCWVHSKTHYEAHNNLQHC